MEVNTVAGLNKWMKKLFADELMRSAEAGSPIAQFMLGKEFISGIKRKKDVDRGFELIEQAADNDHIEAELYLANAYKRGRGVQRNENKVEYWLERAYLNGNPEAAIKLANILLDKVNRQNILIENQENFLGNADNTELCYEIKDMIDYACEREVVNAMVVSGLLFMYGGINDEVFPVDYEQGIVMLKRAANKGSKEAMKAIGDAYMNGTGVECDENEAKLWYDLANNE